MGRAAALSAAELAAEGERILGLRDYAVAPRGRRGDGQRSRARRKRSRRRERTRRARARRVTTGDPGDLRRSSHFRRPGRVRVNVTLY